MSKNSNPWLGLASYKRKDAHLFFGRDAEIKDLYYDIVHNKHTIVFGPSGVGKSSIIQAGIFPKVEETNLFPVYVRLNHEIESTESYPVQIIKSIENSLKNKNDNGEENIIGEIENIITPISKDESSLWEFLHSNRFWSVKNFPISPLLVIDQFEEIFIQTKDKKKRKDFFEQLADLCNDKMPNYIRDHLNESGKRCEYPDNINYRIVISLREDFLARLEEEVSIIPSLRRNRFSLQAINGKQAKEIITNVGKEAVTDITTLEIIKKVAKKENLTKETLVDTKIEAPILNLFCKELWDKKIKHNEEVVTLDLIQTYSDNIIADFYNRIIKKVRPHTVKYLELHLLSTDGKYRTDIPYHTAINSGITRNEIDMLKNNRIIRIDRRSETERIELTHDVLLKPAIKNKERRNRRKRMWKIVSIMAILAAISLILAIVLGSDYGSKKETIAEIAKEMKKPIDMGNDNIIYMGMYEVSQKQFSAIRGYNPSIKMVGLIKDDYGWLKKGVSRLMTWWLSDKEKEKMSIGDNISVHYVSWIEADHFIKELNNKNDKYEYDFPTVEEWKYAAKGGVSWDKLKKELYLSLDKIIAIIAKTNISPNKKEDYEDAISKIKTLINNEKFTKNTLAQDTLIETKYSGSDFIEEVAIYIKNAEYKVANRAKLNPNGYGLYDMSGNLWEFCLQDSVSHIIGGSYLSNEKYCRMSNSSGFVEPHIALDDVGFRLKGKKIDKEQPKK